MIRKAVLEELARRNISISELARQSGIHRVSLQNWIGGQRGIGLEAAERVMQSLHLIVASASAARAAQHQPRKKYNANT